jgi:hypothetical protein
LTEVLRKHRKLLGQDITIDEPVKHISKKRGIVDLMLSRALRRHRAKELEHLVVELKAPKVKIRTKEVTQIEEYAISVAGDERFRTADGVQWTFWVLSDEVDSYAAFRMKGGGIIEEKDNIRIGIKTWAQNIQENNARLQFFQEKLEYEADRAAALTYLQNNYKDILIDVVIPATIESDAEDKDEPAVKPRVLSPPSKKADG